MVDTPLTANQPSLLIKLIVIKKGLFALILIAISLLSALSWRNFEWVTTWSETHVVTAEYDFGRWLLTTIAHSNIPTLKLLARLTGVYGGLLGMTAIGLWQGRVWADPLFIVLVGVLIPIEILEISHHITFTKAIISIINLLVFGVVLKHWFDQRKKPTLGDPVS